MATIISHYTVFQNLFISAYYSKVQYAVLAKQFFFTKYSINPHMVILFLYTYLVIRGVKVPPRVISGSITDINKIPRVTLIFGVEQLNGTIVLHTRHKGSPEIQDGGLQTGSTYIPACRRDRRHFKGYPPFSG